MFLNVPKKRLKTFTKVKGDTGGEERFITRPALPPMYKCVYVIKPVHSMGGRDDDYGGKTHEEAGLWIA